MTAQISDTLTVDGEWVNLMGCPALPWHHPRLKEISGIELDEARRKAGPFYIFSSACWRNYVARWRIDQNRLYLEGVEGVYKLEDGEPLFADWVTETLSIGCGGMLEYVHMGFGSVFEEDLLLKVHMGVIVGRTVLDNRDKTRDGMSLALENLPTEDSVTPGWTRGKH